MAHSRTELSILSQEVSSKEEVNFCLLEHRGKASTLLCHRLGHHHHLHFSAARHSLGQKIPGSLGAATPQPSLDTAPGFAQECTGELGDIGTSKV